MCSLHLEKQGRCYRIVICCNNNSNHEDHTPCESPLLARAPSRSHPVILFGETRFRKIRKHGHTAGKQQKQGPSLDFPDFPTPQTPGEGRVAGEREEASWEQPWSHDANRGQVEARGTQREGKMKRGPGLWDGRGQTVCSGQGPHSRVPLHFQISGEKGLSWQGSGRVVRGPPQAAGWGEAGIKPGG